MRILKWILGIIIALLVIFLAGAFLLPKEVEVARTIEIDAPASEIFPHVNNLKAGEAWSPWLSRDPEVQLAYSGPDDGVGAKLDWTSNHPQVGNGTSEITASEPSARATVSLARTLAVSREATSVRSRSPAPWPRVSFTRLK